MRKVLRCPRLWLADRSHSLPDPTAYGCIRLIDGGTLIPPADGTRRETDALSKVPTGIQGFDEITGRRAAQGARLSGRRLRRQRQDRVRHELPGERRREVRRTRAVRQLRGDVRGPRGNFASQGFDLKGLQDKGLVDLDHIRDRAQRDGGDGRVRPRGPVRAPRRRHRRYRGQARRARHHRGRSSRRSTTR